MLASNVLYDTVCTMVNNSGGTSYGRITFEATSSEYITKEMAMELQAEKGKHPAGYGFMGFFCKEFGEGKTRRYKAAWQCSGSCD
jgi:hypothetical protein